jgi:hypothetical protein
MMVMIIMVIRERDVIDIDGVDIRTIGSAIVIMPMMMMMMPKLT